MNDNLDPTGENFTPEEFDVERALRPLSFDDFTGQAQVLENLKIFVEAANQRGEALDHTLFHGPPGLGKTTLAMIRIRISFIPPAVDPAMPPQKYRDTRSNCERVDHSS